MTNWGQSQYGTFTYGGEHITADTGLPAIILGYKNTKECLIRCYGDKMQIFENKALTFTMHYDDYMYIGDIVYALKASGKFEAITAPGTSSIPIANEGHVIPNAPPYQVQLAYKPQTGTLYITGMVEVTFNPGPGQFRCDYANGILEFNLNDVGQLFTANYTSVRLADLSKLPSKYLAIQDNWNKRIYQVPGADSVTVTYHPYVTTVYDVLQEIPGIELKIPGALTDVSTVDGLDHRKIERYLEEAVQNLQNRTRIFFRQMTIKCDLNPYSLVNEVGVNCDLLEPPYDGTDTNYLKLRYEPLIEVQRIELVYLGNLVRSYPFEWIQKNKRNAEVRIIPVTGSFHLMGMYSGSYLFHSFFPRSTSMFGNFLPWIQIDYQSGFIFGTLPADLQAAVTKTVAIKCLKVADNFLMPGLASKSIDGVSESYTRNAQSSIFGYKIKEYQEEVEALLKPWRRIRMAFA